MKTNEEILLFLSQRFTELEDLIEFYTRAEIETKETHQWKKHKMCEESLLEYNAEQREVIRLYAYITEDDFIVACRKLYELDKEKRQ